MVIRTDSKHLSEVAAHLHEGQHGDRHQRCRGQTDQPRVNSGGQPAGEYDAVACLSAAQAETPQDRCTSEKTLAPKNSDPTRQGSR